MKIALNVLKQEDIRQQIIDYLNSKNEYGLGQTGQFDFSSGNLSYFIDVMSIVTMMLNYNISSIPNNIFLDTIELKLRKNGVSKAKEMGYTPKRPTSAKFRGTLYYTDSNLTETSELTINPRSPFIGKNGNVYLNTTEIKLTPIKNSDGTIKTPIRLSGDYTLSEGTYKYSKFSPTGNANFSFVLNNSKIDSENFSLFVIPQNVIELTEPYDLTPYYQYKWEPIKTFMDLVSQNVYTLEEDVATEGALKIVFGNDIFGKIPLITETVYCEYFETKGASANNELLISLPPSDVIGTTTTLRYYNTTLLGNNVAFDSNNFDSSFQSSKSFGGTDIESLSGIQFNAPKFYSSVGRATTKNDYVYLISTFDGVGSINVVGGDELFPNTSDYLGNIYICVVPSNLNISDANIYISNSLETDIKNRLKEISIISTRRHIYKPTYVVVNVTPMVEVSKSISVVSQDNIKNQITALVVDYFNTKYSSLGIPFRSSKITDVVDTLSYVISSYTKLMFDFVMNERTVSSLIDNVNNILYLPVLNVKDVSGNITGTTNFIKTNSQVIQTEINFADWTIFDRIQDLVSIPEYKTDYLNKIKLLNNLHLSLSKDQSSVYSSNGISSKYGTERIRYIKNNDYRNTNVLDVVNSGSMISFIPYSYKNWKGNLVTTSIQESGSTKQLVFTILDSSYNYISVNAGNIVIDENFNVDFVFASESQKESIWFYLGIDESRYIFRNSYGDAIPFEIVQTSSNSYSVKTKVITYDSSVELYGKYDIVSVNNVSRNLVKSTAFTNWDFVADTDNPGYYNILYNSSKVGLLETNNSTHFKFFVGTSFGTKNYFSEVVDKISQYQDGDYFIVKDYFEANGEYYQVGDVLFVDNGIVSKAITKKKITSAIGGELYLNTNYVRGDYFLDGTDYKLFTFNTTVPFVDSTLSLDSSKYLPKAVANNTLVKIISDTDSAKEIYYSDGTTKKFESIMRYNVGWATSSDTTVVNGDLLLYNDSNWYLIDNILDSNNRVVEIANINAISSHNLYDTFKVTSPIVISISDDIQFVTSPNNNILNVGDYLICVDAGTSFATATWLVFDNDFYSYTVMISDSTSDESSKFPIIVTEGTTFDIINTTSTITNFNNSLQPNFSLTDKIVYIGENKWKQFNTSSVVIPYSEVNVTAVIGDMIEISDNGGNLNNTALINCPTYKLTDVSPSNKLFGYNDKLIFTGTYWEKVSPYNIYNFSDLDITNTTRTTLNGLEFNSDLFVDSDNSSVITIVLNDIFHETSLGVLDYYTGKFVLNLSIDKHLNKTTTGTGTLSDIFDYVGRNSKLDYIRMKPLNADGNFDTTFNQYIIAQVQPTTLI